MATNILSFADLQKYIEQMVNQHLAQLGRKVVVGKVVLQKEGWLRIPFTDVTGSAVTFSEPPVVSVSAGAVSKSITKPTISAPVIPGVVGLPKYQITKFTLDKYKINQMPKLFFSVPTPTIPSLSLPQIPSLGNFSQIKIPTLPQIPPISKQNFIPSSLTDYFTVEFSVELPVSDFWRGWTTQIRSFGQSVRFFKKSDLVNNNKLTYEFPIKTLVNAVEYFFNGVWTAEIEKPFLYLSHMVMTPIKAVAEALDKSINLAVIGIDSALTKAIDSINSAISAINNNVIGDGTKPGTINYIINQVNNSINNMSQYQTKITEFRDNLQTKLKEWVNLPGSQDCLTARITAYTGSNLDNVRDTINSILDTNLRDIETKASSLVDSVNTVIGNLTNDINKKMGDILSNINSAMKGISTNVTDGMSALVDSIWSAIGIVEQKQVFVPVMIRNVSTSGFELYSKGGNGIIYYIAIGK